MKSVTYPISNQVKFLICTLIFLVSYNVFSQNLQVTGVSHKSKPVTGYVSSPDVNPDIQNMLNYYDKQVYFTSNSGQWDSKVLYRAEFEYGQAIATQNGMVVGTFDPADVKAEVSWGMRQEEAIHNHVPFKEPAVKVKGNGWMMNFLNHSPAMTVESEIKHKDVFNYFRGNHSNSNVYSYQEIWYKNVYDSVDVRYYPSKDGSLEYDMVCKPGFKKDGISIKMDGISNVTIKENGSLTLKTSVGEMNLPTPVAYQNIDGKRVKVEVHYEVSEDNIVTFDIGKFDKSKTLLIDPIALRWATWINSNSTGANHGHCIWVDGAGNIYTVARVDGSTNMITTGAFDTIPNGGIDLIIGKYTEPDSVGGSGTRVWQTYVGGSADDNPYACQMGPDGNLYITGYTASTDFPLTGGTAFSGTSIDDRAQNANNIFIMKITPDGQSIKSSVIGGNGNDESYDLGFSSTGDIVVCGNTESTNLDSLFGGSGATNTNHGGVDVLVFKINSDLSAIKWMKNYGGSGTDQANIMLDNPANDDIYVAGYTTSNNFPVTRARQSTLGGGVESGFIQKLNSNGNTIWSSYFDAASAQTAQILCMEFNTQDNSVYFGGVTSGLNANNISSGAYQTTYGGGTNDFFVANIDTNQTFISGTYLGGSGNEVNMMGLNTDQNNDVYIFGYTTSTNFPTTSGALQTSNLGNDNMVFFKLHTTLDSLDFSTYYGGSVDDYDPVGERGIKFSNCRIFTILTSESPDIPLTKGAITTTKLSSTSVYEPGLAVWANPPDLVNNTITGNQSVCYGAIPSPLTGSVPVYSLPAISRNNVYSPYPNIGSSTVYQWQLSIDSVNWTNVPGGTTQNLASSLMGALTVTTYYRRIISGDACIIAGAAGQVIKVIVPSVGSSNLTNVSCYGLNNGAITAAPSGPSPWTFTWSTGATTQTISNLTPGTYSVSVVDGNTCTAKNTFTITQPLVLAVSIGSITNVNCNGNSTGSISLSPTGGTLPYTYSWSPKGGTAITASSLSIGTYSVLVTDAHGCTATTSATITQPTVLTAVGKVTANVSCSSGNNGSGNVTAGGGTPPYSYNWSNGTTTSSVSSIAAGTYPVTVKDANGCSATASITITQPGILTAAAGTSANVSCNGFNNGSASVNASGGTSPYTYSWSNGATTSNISSLIAGVYNVIVTDAHTCNAMSSATISQPSPLSAVASTTANITCNGGNNGSASVSVSGGTSPYTYSWSSGITSTGIGGLFAGTYTVTVKDIHGCSTTASTTITQPVAMSNTTSQSNVTTYGGSNGSASITVSGGTTPYTYSWSTGATASSISGLSIGNYSVTVKDANGCSTSANVNIIQPVGPTITVMNTSEPCNGNNLAAASVSASGGTPPYTYSWSNGATTSSISSLSAGTYSVTVLDANTAPATGSVTVTQPNILIATAIATENVSCNGGNNGIASSTVSGGTPAYTYSWSTGAATTSISSLPAGTYSLTVTDAQGCTATASVSITQPANSLNASAYTTSNVLCNAGNNGSASVTISGGTSPYTYSWSNGKSTNSISSLSAGTYTITAKDVNGCTAISSATITQPAASVSAVATTTTNVSCYGGSNAAIQVTASGGTSPYNYSWSNGATATVVNGLVAGTYTVTVKDANGCTAIASTTVSQPPMLSNSTSQSNVNVEYGNNGSATATPSGGTTPYTYSWSNGATTPSITGLVAGSYVVNITDLNGCTSTAKVQITQPGTNITVINTNEPCNGNCTATASVTASGGTSPYTYSWSNGATTSSISGLCVGTYTITVNDNLGSTTSTTVIINQPSNITATGSVLANVSCNGFNNGDGKVIVSGGTPPYTYSWSNGILPVSTSNPTGSVLSAGTYTVTVNDVNDCTPATATITITQPANALGITVSSVTNILCNGNSTGSVSVLASGGTSPYTYSWSPSGGTKVTASSLSAGTYSITVTDNHGCSATASATVTQPLSALGITISSFTNVSCHGGTGSATANAATGGTSPYTYSWSGSEGTNLTINPTAGTFTITATDNSGCTATARVTITQPSVALTTTAPVSNNVSCNGLSNGGASATPSGGTSPYTYSWSNGISVVSTSKATGSALSAGTYTVSITDAHGCTALASITITQPNNLTTTASASLNVSCNGLSNGDASATPAGGTSPYTYSWTNGSATVSKFNPTGSTLSAGTYTVSVTDAHGCAASASVTITQPPALTTTVLVLNNVSCNGLSNGDASATPAGGTSPYTYSWYNGISTISTSNPTGSVLSAGTYTVTVKDANGCSISAGIIISQPVLLSSTTSQTNVTLIGGDDGSATVNATGGTTPYTYLWSNGGYTSSISSLSAGTYNVTVTDVNECTTSATVNIVQGPIVSASNTNESCNGGNNASASAIVTGGELPYTYSWSNGATSSSTSSLSAGTYSVTIQDADNESATTSIIVTQPAPLTPTATVSANVSCNGSNNGSASVGVSGGVSPYTYSWSNEKTTIAISNLSAGTYTITVTDNDGCSASNSATISQPNALIATATTSTNVLCYSENNGSGSVIGSGGTSPYTYSWSNGKTTSSISNLAAGTFTVVVKDANGCSISSSMTISQPLTLIAAASITGSVSCHGVSNGSASSSPSGGTSPYTYSWSNGATTSSISNLAAGTFTINVSDANGCSASSSITISQPSVLVATVSTTGDVSCNGGSNGKTSVSASGGTTPYTYYWSYGGVTTSSVTGLTAGTYSVTVTDKNECSTTASTTVTQPLTLSNSTSQTDVTINGNNDGSASASASGGTTPYTYSWSNKASASSISSLIAGTYTVLLTDANGCTSTASVTITQPNVLIITATNTNDYCYGSATATASVTVSGGVTPYTYLWSNGATTPGISSLSAGTYKVAVADANGASASTLATVVQRADIVATVSAYQNVSCNGENNGGAFVLVSGESQSYLYSWSTGATTTVIGGLSAGTYTLTITDSYGCTYPYTIAITQPNTLIASSSSTNVTCNGANNGTGSVSVNGGTYPYTYSWSNGDTTSSISSLAPGTYSVSILDSNGCATTAGIMISQPNTLTVSTSSNNILCKGGDNGSGNVSASGGTPPYTYSWSNGTTASSISSILAGTYTVTVKDANDCSASSSISITQPNILLTSAAASNNVSCDGGDNGSGGVSVSGGTSPYTYSWSNGATTSSISGLDAGSYNVTVNDANGCTSTTGITISEPSILTNITSNTNLTINGNCIGTASVTASGGTSVYLYSWATGAITSTISNLCAGTYTVLVTDLNGCTTTGSVTITQPAEPLVITPTNTNDLCNNNTNATASVTASGGTSPYTYSWSDGATESSISSLSAGTYSVSVTDANGATATASVTVTQPGTLTSSASATTNVSCNSGDNGSASVGVSGGTADYTYSWSTGATTTFISNLSAGTYTVTVTDANGCTTTSEVTITQPVSLTNITSQTNITINGQSSGSASVSASGGTSPYTYSWNNEATTSTDNGLSAGTYTVLVTDANGCTSTASVTITQPPMPLVITPTNTNDLCNNNTNAAASVTASGGVPAYTYSWSDGATESSISSLSAGTYSVSVTDANGATASASVTVTQPGTLTSSASATTDVSCNSADNGIASVSASGGTADYTYSWSTGATTTSISNLSAGTYTVTVTDANGCTASSAATITQPASALGITISSVTNVSCNGGTGTITAKAATGGTSPYTYSWSPGGGTGLTATVSAGTYTITATDAHGCTASASATITQPASVLGITISSVTDVSCNEGTGTATAKAATGGTSPYTYSWSPGGGTGLTATVSAGTYTITATDAHGCTATASATITQPASVLGITISSITNVSCNGGTGTATAKAATGGTSPYTYSWSPGGGTGLTATVSAGTYTISVTDAHGCTASASATITQPASALGITISSVTDVSCNGGTGTATAKAATGGTSPYTYTWSPGGGTGLTATVSAGTYTISVIDAHGCTASASATITQPASALGITISSLTNVSCNGGTGTATAKAATGGTSPYTYTWSPSGGTSLTATVSAGTYTITATDNHGCTATASATITQPAAALGITISSLTNVSCNGGTGTATARAATGGSSPYTYSWSPGGGTGLTATVSAGTYTITATDNHGCIATASATITQPASALGITISSVTDVSCNGGTGTATAKAATGGTSPYTYTWSPGGGTGLTATVSAGTYTISMIDAHGCTASASATITQPAGMTLTTSVTANVSCNGSSTGSASVKASGGTSPYTYSWASTGGKNASATGLSAGTYTVHVTSNGGCASTATVTITQPAAITVTMSSTNASCNTDGSVTATVSGGTSPYTYKWGSNCGSQTTSTATSLTAGTYTLSITDKNGCSATGSVTITQSPGVSVSTSVSANENCNGANTGSASATVSGGTSPYTYSWAASGGSGSSANSLSAGIYTINVTDKNGCTATASATITQPSAMTLTTSVTANVSCNGSSTGSATVKASGGTSPYTYSWASTGGKNVSATGLSAGTYTISVIDAHECTASASATITQPAAITITTSSTNATCNVNGTATANVSGGTSPYTYKWSGSQTKSSATNLSAGTYTITVTDAHGCTATASVTVSTSTTFYVITCAGIGGSPGYCGDGGNANCAELHNSTGVCQDGLGNSYISDHGNNCIRKVNASGIISTCIGNGTQGYSGDGGSCTSAELNTPSSVCEDASGNIYIADYGNNCIRKVNTSGIITTCAGNGTAGYSGNSGSATSAELYNPSGVTCDASGNLYIADYGNNCIRKVNTSGIITTCAGNGTSGYSGDGGTCTSAELHSPSCITLDGSGNLYIGDYGNNCVRKVNTSGIITTCAGNGTAGYSGDGGSCTSAELNNPNGLVCDGSGNLYISDYSNHRIRCVNTSGIITTCAGNGTAGYSGDGGEATACELNFPSGLCLDASGNVCISEYGNHCLRKLANSCTPAVTVTLNGNVSCNGGDNGSATAKVCSGTTPYTYSWSNGKTASSVSSLSAGTYTVKVTDASGNTASAGVLITQPAAMNITTIVTADVECNAGSTGSASATVSGGTSPYTYSWASTGGKNSTATGLIAGTYTVHVTSYTGCTSTASVTITQPTAMTVSAIVTSNVGCNAGSTGSASATVSGGTSPYTYSWTSTGGKNSTATGLIAGTYTVYVTSYTGCTATASVTITQPTAMTVSAIATANVGCNAGSTGSASATVSGGTSPYTYSWASTGGKNSTATGLIAGTYTVHVTSYTGCTATAIATITQPTAIKDSVSSCTYPLCNGGDGSATIGVKGGTGTYNYTWSPSVCSTATCTKLTSGIYTVTVKDNNGCTKSATCNITQPPAIRDSIVTSSCNGSNGSATCGVKGGTQPYAYLWSPCGGTAATLSGLSAGTYTIAIKDNNGCSNTLNFGLNCGISGDAPEYHNDSINSINELPLDIKDVSLYPNPNTGQFTVAGIEKGMIIEVYDAIGRKIRSIISSDVTMQLNISNETEGVYLIRVIDKDGDLVSKKKVIKVR